MPADAAVIVADAHLGEPAAPPAEAFRRFLAIVPDIAGHLVINGDLFDFWFEYRSVIPRHAFETLAALRALRHEGVVLTVTGGNHDRWGGSFWTRELGATFHARSVELTLAGFRALVSHGDGVTEQRLGARAVHAVIGHPLTAATFRLLHPDVGYRLAGGLLRLLGERHRDPEVLDRAADAQRRHARELLGARQELDLVVLGHTHRPILERVEPGRWYLNPGAWVDGMRYAIVTRSGPELRAFAV